MCIYVNVCSVYSLFYFRVLHLISYLKDRGNDKRAIIRGIFYVLAHFWSVCNSQYWTMGKPVGSKRQMGNVLSFTVKFANGHSGPCWARLKPATINSTGWKSKPGTHNPIWFFIGSDGNQTTWTIECCFPVSI